MFGNTNRVTHWGPRVSNRDVRVRFRERAGDLLDAKNLPVYREQVSVRRMSHAEYFDWLENVESKTVQLVGVEQVED